MDIEPMTTWCPQCGPRVLVDFDGTCSACGASAMGAGADTALQALADVERLTRELREARRVVAEIYHLVDNDREAKAMKRAGDLARRIEGVLCAPAIRAAEGSE